MQEAFLFLGESVDIPVFCGARIVERNGLKEGWLDCQITGNWHEHFGQIASVMEKGTVQVKVVKDKGGEVLADLPGFINRWQNDSLCITIAGDPAILSQSLIE